MSTPTNDLWNDEKFLDNPQAYIEQEKQRAVADAQAEQAREAMRQYAAQWGNTHADLLATDPGARDAVNKAIEQAGEVGNDPMQSARMAYETAEAVTAQRRAAAGLHAPGAAPAEPQLDPLGDALRESSNEHLRTMGYRPAKGLSPEVMGRSCRIEDMKPDPGSPLDVSVREQNQQFVEYDKDRQRRAYTADVLQKEESLRHKQALPSMTAEQQKEFLKARAQNPHVHSFDTRR